MEQVLEQMRRMHHGQAPHLDTVSDRAERRSA